LINRPGHTLNFRGNLGPVVVDAMVPGVLSHDYHVPALFPGRVPVTGMETLTSVLDGNGYVLGQLMIEDMRHLGIAMDEQIVVVVS
jgi:hypothetical protein